MRRSFLLLALLPSIASASAQARTPIPPAVAEAVAATTRAQRSFTYDYRFVEGRRDWRYRVAPSRSPRAQLTSPQLSSLSEARQQSARSLGAELRDVPWCASANLIRSRSMALVREDAATATYRFNPTSDSVRNEWAMRSDTSRRFAHLLRGELVLSKRSGDVISVRFFAPGTLRPIPLVRVDAFSVTMRCAPAPNGRYYASNIQTILRGVSFGSAFDQNFREEFTIVAA